MNFIYFCLFLFVARCVLASETGDQGSKVSETIDENVANSPEALKFVKDIGKGDLETAWRVFRDGGAALRKYCGEYMVSLGGDKLSKLFNGTTEYYLKKWILEEIFAHGDLQLLDSVLKTFALDDVILSCDMCKAKIACSATRFITLLNMITDKELLQKNALKNGVSALVKANEPECFDSLISALKKEPTLGPRLVDAAIREAFSEVSFSKDERISFAKRVFNRPAIDEKSYSDALYNSYDRGGPKKETFWWLLARASRPDLKKVIEDSEFSDMPPKFKDAINYALKNAGDETRSQKDERIFEEMTKPVKDPLDHLLPKDLITMVLEYYLE